MTQYFTVTATKTELSCSQNNGDPIFLLVDICGCGWPYITHKRGKADGTKKQTNKHSADLCYFKGAVALNFWVSYGSVGSTVNSAGEPIPLRKRKTLDGHNYCLKRTFLNNDNNKKKTALYFFHLVLTPTCLPLNKSALKCN